MFKYFAMVFWGFSGGVIISGAIFAFIAMIGIVPRLAYKTGTQKYIIVYEEAIIFGGIFGMFYEALKFNFRMPMVFVVVYALCIGIFVGALAVSLAETLDVIPVLNRRLGITKGLVYIMLAIAVGKGVGALMYAVIEEFNFM